MSPLELVDDRFDKLAAELRASRPVVSDALHERVATLTRVEPREPWWRFRPPAKQLALVLVAAALVGSFVAAGLTGLDRSNGTRKAVALHGRNPVTGGRAGPLGRNAPVPFGFEQSPTSLDHAAKVPLSPTAGRLQRYDATLSLRVADVDALSNATKRAMSVTRSLGGYVASVGYSTQGGRRGGATLVLRVPVGNVEAALQKLTSLGTILGQQTAILDVTRRAEREQRQLARLAGELSRIEAQLAAGGLSPEQRAQLERRASADRGALQTLRAKHHRLVRSAQLARIALTLTTPAHQPAAAPGRFRRTLDDAGAVLVRELEILVYALVVVGPLLLIGGAAIVFGRGQRRRSDRRLLERT